MKPVVNLYKLNRLPYVKALHVQQVLFDKLKSNVTSQNQHVQDNNHIRFYELGEGDSKKQLNYINTTKKTQLYQSQSTPRSTTNFQQQKGIPNIARGNSLILVEHEPVYTIGIRSKNYNDNYVSQLKSKLAELELNADFVKTSRGGLITFHGPGQLVAYPIIYLGDFSKTIQNRSVKAYVKLLETTIIDTLASVGLDGAHTVEEYPGVWLDGGERKIAFIGISCKRYVTMHGISINCDCDLSWFDHINSCGIENKAITSVHKELVYKRLNYAQSDGAMNSLDLETSYQPDAHLSNRIADVSSTMERQKKDSSISGTVDNSLSNSSSFTFTVKCGEVSFSSNTSKYNTNHIAAAFCQSFSKHFDCELLTATEDPSLFDTENKL